MGIFGIFRRQRRGGGPRRGDATHLESWAATHHGVEAYVEPRTMVTDTTVVLIAHDGEWTRRRIADPAAARALGRRLGIPVYDVALVGYPQRMRDYTRRQTIIERRRQAARDQGRT